MLSFSLDQPTPLTCQPEGLRYRSLCRSVAPVLASGPALFDCHGTGGGNSWAMSGSHATIRADKRRRADLLQKPRFRDWHFDQGVTLASGQIVDQDQQTVIRRSTPYCGDRCQNCVLQGPGRCMFQTDAHVSDTFLFASSSDALDMFPTAAIRAHGVFRWRRQVIARLASSAIERLSVRIAGF